MSAESSTTPRKLPASCIAPSAGKMMRLEMSMVPTMRMPTTTVTAISSASSPLYSPTRTPALLANGSSKVTAKMRFLNRTNRRMTTAESETESTTSARVSVRMLPNR